MILYLINNDYIVEITGFDPNSGTITNMRYAQPSDLSTWHSFGSVALETPSTMDVNNGYGWAAHKFVGFNESGTGNNKIFFSDPFGPGTGSSFGDTFSFHGLDLSNDWGTLHYDTTLSTAELAINLLGVGLAHNYILDANSTDMVNAVNGSDTGVAYQSELGRNYAYFDASSSYIDLGQSSSMAIGTSDFTISAWVKPDNLSMGFAQIFGSIITGSASPSRQGIHFAIDNGDLRFNIGGNNTMEPTTYALPAEFAGTWNHVVATRSGTEIKMYINGVLVVTNTVASVYDIESTTSWHKYGIGAYSYNNSWYANYVGGIDNVMVYNRALSGTEAADLHTATTVTVPPTVTIDQDPSSVSIGDVMTATVDLQGGTLGYFAWEKYNAESSSWAVVAGGSNSVVDVTVAESMSEAIMKVSMEVDGQWYFSADMTMPVLDINNGLVAKYALDTDADDSFGTNNLSLMGGAVSYGAQDGHSAAAGFSSGELRSGATIDLTGEFTVSFWAKEGTPYTYSGNNYSSFFRWGTHEGSYFDLYLLNGKIRALHSAGSGWVDNRGSVAVPSGWNHYAMTIDPSNGSKIVYLNGVAQTLSGGAFSGTFAASQQVWLGNISTQSGFRLNGGKMDDTRIWNRVLSASEIAGLHETGAEEPPAAPIQKNGYYPLYLTESDANGHAGSNGSSHSHVFDSVTYYMPDGLVMGVTQHHGTYGLALHFAGDDGVDDINGVVATTNGITFVQDEGRDAWDLGTEGVASFTRPFAIGGANDWSMSVWFKNKNSTASSPLLRGSYYWLYANNNSLGVWTSSLQDTGYDLVPTNLQGWHQITAVGTTNLTTYYIDGVEVGSVAANPSDDGTTNSGIQNQLFLGAEWNGQNAWAEMISDFRMHNRSMNADEVAHWYAETTVVYTPSNDVTLTVSQYDSYGDSWNGNLLNVLDSNGVVVGTFNGPASGIAHPAGLVETFDVPTNATYSWTAGGGLYPNEVSFIISKSDGTELVNVGNVASLGAGSFDLDLEIPTIEPSVVSYQSNQITVQPNISVYGQTVGSQWVYSLSDDFVLGQPRGIAGTAANIGNNAVVSVTPGLNIVYTALVDSNGDIIAVGNFSQNTVLISLELNKVDSYGDGWNGHTFTMTDSGGNVVVNETIQTGAGGIVNLQLPSGTYSWEMSSGSYSNEVSMTLTDISSGQVLITIATTDAKPATGSVVLSIPVPEVTAVAISGYESVYVNATANQTALDEGAVSWCLVNADIFGDVGTTINPSYPLIDLSSAAGLSSSTEDTITGYVALVDASGEILAKSSVSGQAMINQMAVGQEMALMAVLAPMFLDDQNILAEAGNIPSEYSDTGELSQVWQFGPFYMGDLQVSSFGTPTVDWSDDYATGYGLLIPTVFDDGMGTTGSADLIGKMVKDLIRKLDLHQLDGDLSPFAVIFQSVLDGSDKDAIKLIDPDESSLMVKLAGGGYSESSQYKFCQQIGELGIGEGIRNMTIPDQVLLLDKRGGSWIDAVDPGAIKGVIAPAESVISGQASVGANGEVTMSASVGEFAIAQGAVKWAYALDQSVGNLGQATTESTIAIGSDLVFTPAEGPYTVYVAAVDTNDIVLAVDVFTFDSTPQQPFKWKYATTDWSGANGSIMTLTDSNGNEYQSPSVSHDTNGAYQETAVFMLPEGIYSWAMNTAGTRTSEWYHLRLIRLDESGAELEEVLYVHGLQERPHLDGTSWPNHVYDGQFSLPADVVDPVISLVGDSAMTVYAGYEFTDPGYVVSDLIDPSPNVTVTGNEAINVYDSWVHLANSEPTIEGEMVTAPGTYGWNYSVKRQTNIAPDEDFEIIMDFDDVSFPYTQYSPELVLRMNIVGSWNFAQISMQNYSNWQTNQEWFAGFGWTNNNGTVYDQYVGEGNLVSTGAMKVVRQGTTMSLYRKENDGDFILMSERTHASYNGEIQIEAHFGHGVPGKITSISRSDIAVGAQLGEHVITYTAEDFSGNAHSVQRALSVVAETYDFSHNGKLQNVVNFTTGFDADGVSSHLYLTDDAGATKLYLTPDLETWSSFTAYDVDDTLIDGAPTSAAYGKDGMFLVGTSTGKLYKVHVGSNSIPLSYTEVGSHSSSISCVFYAPTTDEWLFDSDSTVYTMPFEGGAAVSRMVIPSGSVVRDFSAANDGIAIVIRKSDFTFATYIAVTGWTSVHGETQMSAVLTSLGITDFNYAYNIDSWCAASPDGTVVTTDDISNWLL